MFARYQQYYHTESDIQHHLGLLFALAKGNVLELGTRSGVSTVALLSGVERNGGYVWSIDIDPNCGPGFIAQLTAEESEVAKRLWTFIPGDSRNPDMPGTIATSGFRDKHAPMVVKGLDLILIDTFHAYEVTQTELALWGPYLNPGGTICMHDTETFPGVRRAAQEFADVHGWPITFVLPCHGMAVIVRPMEGVSAEGSSWAMEEAHERTTA